LGASLAAFDPPLILSSAMRSTLLFLPLLLAGCATFASQPKPDVSTVPYVDLARYMGRWYIIDRIPYFLEKGKVAASDNYELRKDGRIKVAFIFRRDSVTGTERAWNGTARVVAPDTNAEWKVRFVWPLEADYRVIELDPDYRWAVISNSSGSLIWIMARTTTLDEGVERSIRDRLIRRRLDVAKLQAVPQIAP